MRYFVAVLIALHALGCSPADPLAQQSQPGEVVSAEAGQVEELGVELGVERCFRVDHSVTDHFPDAAERLQQAFDSWGQDVAITDACDSVLRAEPSPSREGKDALAVHRPLVQRGDAWIPAGLGGASEIVLDTNAIASGRLADMDADTCNVGWDAGETPAVLLSLVLTHEVGHIWGLGESDSQDDVMYFARRVCTELAPSVSELQAVQIASCGGC